MECDVENQATLPKTVGLTNSTTKSHESNTTQRDEFHF